MAQNLISKTALAKLADVNPATITRVADHQFPNAFVGKKIDANHPEVIEYLEMREAKKRGEVIACRAKVKAKKKPRHEFSPPTPAEERKAKKVVPHTPPTGKPYSQIANKYAKDVLSGDIPACKWIKLACQKYIDDLKSSAEFYYCDASASKACRFVELQFHTKGEWAAKKQRLVMESWQIFFVCNIFGWKKSKNDLRRYSEVLLLVPRKNGKSQLAAAIALYMLCADGEHGAEVYCGATSEKQAKEVFIPAKRMVTSNEQMRSHFGVQVFASNINVPSKGSKFEMLIGNPGDGGSPSCAIVDEYHEHKDDSLFSTMETGTMARAQPLIIVTTTAGDNLAGPCYSMQLEAQRQLEGSVESAGTLFSMIYTVDAGDEWDSVETLKKANPNFGVSVVEDVIMGKLATAKANARKQNAYKTKHLNVWVGARDAFFNIEKWNLGQRDITLKDYLGKDCYIGLDLASKKDIAALEMLFPNDDGTFATFGKHYLPEEALLSTASEHYGTWSKEGFLTLTEGSMIDFFEIERDILDLCGMFNVLELAFDPNQATMLVTSLMKEGLNLVEIPPYTKHFSEPMKELDGLILDGKVLHNGDPVMTWMMSNVTAKPDARDCVYPRKDRPENKIDGPVALIIAFNRYMNSANKHTLDDFIDNQISVNF